MTKPCKGIDLLYLAERYEYRVMATSVMDHILFEADLSDGARTLWMILYRGAALNEGVRCEASVSFLKNKTGKSEATLWRHIRELRSRGYLEVETRKGLEGESLPNIYGPRIPATKVRIIKSTATPREVVSRDIAEDEMAATTRDYENPYNAPSETTSECKVEQELDTGVTLRASDLSCETFSEQKSTDVAVETKTTLRNEIRSRVQLTYPDSKSETGEGVKTERENTTTPPTEGYTTTGRVKRHSRDQWKCFPHIRLQVLERLIKMGIDRGRAKVLMSEIDWTLKFGSMEWWNVQKGVNVCLKLIREGRWKSPRFSV